MADSMPPQKKHNNVFTFTSLVFLISSILIILIVLIRDRTPNLFLSPSVDHHLFSNSDSSFLSPHPQPESTRPEPNNNNNNNNNTHLIQQPISLNNEIIEENEEVGFVNEPGSDNGSDKYEIKKLKNSCNLYMGNWVRYEEYPIYKPGSCPFVDEAYDCQINGRPDSEYIKWRWKPDGCDLPRFNATDFLTRIRGKKLMLVGDSMNRNQFESMLCLLREGLPDKSRMYEVHGYKITKGRGFYIFKFVDFNCSIQFVRSHFLVKEETRKNAQGNSNPTLSIDQIDKNAKKWKKADILVFNTGHWWTHGKTARGKNYFKEGGNLYSQFDPIEAYKKSLKTWGEWIDKNINPKRQMVFYRGYSSAHFRGGDWNSGGTCNGETEPILGSTFRDSYPLQMKFLEDVIQNMKVPVIFLNVTRLTNFRKDGHPSVYGKTRKQDCSHWCLPGVPDAWNELIYATLVYQQTTISYVLNR